MFYNSKIILAVGKGKITVSVVKGGSPPVIEKKQEFAWNKSNILEVLQNIKTQFGSSVRVLCSDEFIYLITLKAESTNSPPREAIGELAQEFIPENLQQTTWDYTVYPNLIMVTVLNVDFHNEVIVNIKKVGFTIEVIEPYSSSFANQLADETDPLILLYQADNPIAIVIQNGVPLLSSIIQPEQIPAQIEHTVIFSQDKFNIAIKKIIYEQSISSDFFSTDFLKSIPKESRQLDPALGLPLKSDIKTPEIDLTQSHIPRNFHVQTSSIPYIIFFISFSITIAFVMGVHQLTQEPKVQPTAQIISATPIPPTLTPTLQPVATESADREKTYTIIVLNGSNVPGEATRLSNILKKQDYNVVLADNTENATAGIHIQYKNIVQKQYLEDLDNTLKNIYSDIDIEPKLASDEADITITIGTFTKK